MSERKRVSYTKKYPYPYVDWKMDTLGQQFIDKITGRVMIKGYLWDLYKQDPGTLKSLANGLNQRYQMKKHPEWEWITVPGGRKVLVWAKIFETQGGMTILRDRTEMEMLEYV